jgi:AcrR family transcriptional regulator
VRARLLEAAADVLGERGFAGASVEEVSARAGFSRGAFYSNFRDKEELFLEVLERHSAERVGELEQLVGPDTTPEMFVTALHDFVERRSAGRRHRFERYMGVWLHAATQPSLRARLARVERRRQSIFADAVSRMFGAMGLEPPVPPDQLGALLSALDHGTAVQTLLEPTRTKGGALALAAISRLALDAACAPATPATHAARQSSPRKKGRLN